MDRRLELQHIFESILGSRNVYFDPPESVKMSYPAIRYTIEGIDLRRANDSIYKANRFYEVTLIDYDQDSAFIDPLLNLKYSSFSRHYVSDNLHHFVYRIYY